MRIIKEFPEFAAWKDIREAAMDGPAYFVERASVWRTNQTALLPTSGLIVKSDTEIHLVGANKPYSGVTRTYSPKINHSEPLIIFRPDSFEFIFKKKITFRTRRKMDQILDAYHIDFGWIPCGPQRGEDCVLVPHPYINPDPEYGWPRTEEFLMRGMHSVILQPGIAFDYKGNCVTDKAPSLAQCKKIVTSFMKRSSSARSIHEAASKLGFYTGFETNGYPLPKDRSPENVALLNEQAKLLGYKNVGEAWEAGVPIVGEIDDQWMEHHEQGLTGLLADSIKESRKKK